MEKDVLLWRGNVEGIEQHIGKTFRFPAVIEAESIPVVKEGRIIPEKKVRAFQTAVLVAVENGIPKFRGHKVLPHPTKHGCLKTKKRKYDLWLMN